MTMTLRIFGRIAAAAAVTLAAATAGAAPEFPSQPIRMIVPYPPGGATDIIGRVLAEQLSNTIGQRVIVENRAGAGGSIGAAAVANAAPDGYTLLMGALTSHSINMSLMAKPGFDLEKGFAPVSLAGNVGLAMVVHPSLPATTVGELVALAKAQPTKVNFASAGNGSPQHLAGELFNTLAGTKLLHVPYKGSAPAVTDLLGGQVQMMIDTIPSVLPHIKGGKVRALGVTTAKPSELLPGVPTVASQGLPNYEVSSWFGVLAPAGTPPEVVQKLNQHVVRALQSPQAIEALQKQGATATPGTPQEASRLIRSEIQKWAQVIKAAGVQQE